jgi:hypothetical protein
MTSTALDAKRLIVRVEYLMAAAAFYLLFLVFVCTS